MQVESFVSACPTRATSAISLVAYFVAQIKFSAASVEPLSIDFWEKVTAIGLFKFSMKNEIAEAVYAKVSVPCVRIIPSILSSSKCGRMVSVIVFQSFGSMSPESFMNGDSIEVMFAMSFNSGAIFNISSASVGITAPVFGSSLEEIVPPVIIIAMFGSPCFFSKVNSFLDTSVAFSITFASRISPSLIPMLYPDSNFSKTMLGSWDSKMCPVQTFPFVFKVTFSPGSNTFVCIYFGI